MLDDHLDLATLRGFAGGELGREALFDTAWHLFVCEACRDRLSELGPEAYAIYDLIYAGSGLRHADAHYSELTRAVAAKLRDAGLEIERQRSQADALWEELRPHPHPRRLLMIENTARFRTVGLVELLLAECRRTWHRDPARAEEIAELGLGVAYRLDPERYGPALPDDLKAEAWVCLGTCRRLRADVRSIAEAFEIAASYRATGTGDPLQEAESLEHQARLLRDLRRFGEASDALGHAARLHRSAGDSQAEGSALLEQANAEWERGAGESAIELLDRASQLLRPDRDPRLAFAARHDLARFRALSGRANEAAAQIPALRRLARELDDPTLRLRLAWTEGLVLARQGRLLLAEASLRSALEGFTGSGAGFDAAFVALDLVSVLLEAGRSAEARRLADDLVPILASPDVHREARAALARLRQAVAEETATVPFVHQLARYLRQARRQAALRFESR